MCRLLFLAMIFAIALALPASALAQQGMRMPPPGAGDKNMRNESDELKMRSLEIERVRRDANKPEAAKPTPSFPLIKEDFERIQILNSDVIQADAAKAIPDYKLLLQAAAEMKKRATRLKSNLFPSASKERSNVKVTAEPQDMKSLLAALDDVISNFVHSPIFQNTEVVNPQDSEKAERELEKIIKLSTRLGKEAGEMKKANSGGQGKP